MVGIKATLTFESSLQILVGTKLPGQIHVTWLKFISATGVNNNYLPKWHVSHGLEIPIENSYWKTCLWCGSRGRQWPFWPLICCESRTCLRELRVVSWWWKERSCSSRPSTRSNFTLSHTSRPSPYPGSRYRSSSSTVKNKLLVNFHSIENYKIYEFEITTHFGGKSVHLWVSFIQA